MFRSNSPLPCSAPDASGVHALVRFLFPNASPKQTINCKLKLCARNAAESLAMCSTAYTMKLQLLIFMLVLILGSISADSSLYDCVVKQYTSNSNLIMHAFIKRVSALNRRCYRRHLALITLRTGRNHPCLFPAAQFVSHNFSSCKYSTTVTTVINCSRVHLSEWPETILSKD